MPDHLIRVADLPDESSTRALLHCPRCGGEYSAYRGDYFMARPETVMKCCRRPLRLVTRHTVYRQFIAASADPRRT